MPSNATVKYRPQRAGEEDRRRLGVQYLLGSTKINPESVRDLGLPSNNRRLWRFRSRSVASPSEESAGLRPPDGDGPF